MTWEALAAEVAQELIESLGIKAAREHVQHEYLAARTLAERQHLTFVHECIIDEWAHTQIALLQSGWDALAAQQRKRRA